MVLMLFMARYLTFADIGAFSLMVGTTALLPGAVGLGLSYFVNREVVGGDTQASHLLARDRLIVTFVCGVASALGVAMFATIGLLDLPVDLRIFCGIVILEMIGFDLQLLLIARQHPGLANFLLFLRTASWIPAFILASYLDPAHRNIDFLSTTWIVGEILSMTVATIALRHVFREEIFVKPFNVMWLRQQFPRVLPVWISDFSLAVGQNVDRFVISFMIGVKAAGIYFFFFAIGNAAFQIVQSATIQPFMPLMRQVYKSSTKEVLDTFIHQSVKKVVFFSAAIMACAGVGSVLLVIVLNRPELHHYMYLIIPIMVGMMAKSVNECLGIVDYVTENDFRYIGLNVLALAVTAVVLSPSTWLFGLMGASASFLITMTFFAALRWRIWRRAAVALSEPKLVEDS
ncbi:hypothetical protein COA07_17175 [Sphingomonas adhaesiva]|uniref:Polysaccharide biosynthesis protein C-terminal domain-containing protein n=2 Tax=Sphingomonas adhaesiva TaxID=28212 RepID=A0A2A4I5A0_9SPHN|nr:hypothetical protein COA07_17175 [Sphingomonas adhaesiva]